MRRFVDRFALWCGGSHKFAFGSLTILGRSSGKNRKYRALLFSDSFGPTLQANFIRPLTRFGAEESWGTWTITETAQDSLECAEQVQTAERDLVRVVAVLRPAVIVVSRYAGPLASAVIRLSRDHSIPLIAHLDDNLFDVPESPGASPSRHASLQRQSRLKELLVAADLDLISTTALEQILDRLGVLGQRRMVAEIAGAAPILGKLKRPSGRRITFGYMGTRSHTEDLAMIAPAIARLLERHPEARFELFGSIEPPPGLSAFGIRRHEKIQDYDRFLRRLASLDWAFGLAPLQITPFTLAKTNIKWIEYTAAGIPVIASDHPIYRECCADGAGILAGPDDWSDAMGELAASEERRASVYAAAEGRLVSEYTPARMHRQIIDAFATAGVAL